MSRAVRSWGFGRRARGAFERSEILDPLAEAGVNIRRAAELAAELFRSWPDDSAPLRSEIRKCEHRGDELTRRIVHTLHRSELRPFERDDIYKLAAAIDDVVDDIDEAVEETAMYRIEAPLEQAEALAGVLGEAAGELAGALGGLSRLGEIDPHLQRVRSHEQEGDRIYRDALAALFDGGIDPMLVIRWKDVLEAIEEAIDRCRNAADILRGIVVKHA